MLECAEKNNNRVSHMRTCRAQAPVERGYKCVELHGSFSRASDRPVLPLPLTSGESMAEVIRAAARNVNQNVLLPSRKW